MIEQVVAVRTRGLNAAAYLITYTALEENDGTHRGEWRRIVEEAGL
ncbi:MAG: hypothetical protein J6125_02555 [Clostridia bacterium]|nr:hypothetical protein [Clostridia bacterium]